MQSVGSNLIIITPGAPNNGKFSSPASAQGIIITSLQQRDVDSIGREPSVSEAASFVSGQAEVVYGNNNKTVSYQGVTSNMFSVRNLTLG